MQKNDAATIGLPDFLKRLGTTDIGLSSEQARQNITRDGANVITTKKTSPVKIFFQQFQSSLIYLMLVASAISFAIQDYSDGSIILVILLINTLLGFYQEYKSSKVVEKLLRFIAKQVVIKRDGIDTYLDETQIAVGDAVIVREGDIIPADMRILTANDVQADESELTGESVAVDKKPNDLLFTGSTIKRGEALGIVYATGRNTQLGTIAKLSTETKKITQYQESLTSFSSFLVKITLIGLAAVFIMKLVVQGGFTNITNMVLFIIAMAVAVVPEALPVIATVTLSNGALKLSKDHVVVKRLSALEDLGNVNLLCTDKTGTITENKMAIEHAVSTDMDLFQMLAYATITPMKSRKHVTINSYDDAFLAYVPKSIADEASKFSIIKDLPFDPTDRRRRVVVKNSTDGTYYLVVIGAPETLLDISSSDEKTHYLTTITAEGMTGLHHLGLAYKKIDYSDGFDILRNESGIQFLGYVSLTDPLRPSATQTIKDAEALGIAIKILTGDSREVAEYVGTQVGLVPAGSHVFTGDELDAMSPEEFNQAVLSTNVFARVSPVQKFNIIQSLKQQFVVAYQGDGINDAPALKLADVAIAVNTATDIAKENADIVLLNTSLEVIISGIKYGRSVFVNINKYIRHTMVGSFGNFIALAVLYLGSSDLPLLPVQVLLTTILSDIPLVTIASDRVESIDVVRPEKHNVRELVFISLILGVPTAIVELFYFFIVRNQPHHVVETSLFVFLTFTGLIIFYSIRTKNYFWNVHIPPMLLNASFALAFAVSLAVIYIPVFQKLFSFAPLSLAAVGVIVGLSIVYFVVLDLIKTWYYKLQK